MVNHAIITKVSQEQNFAKDTVQTVVKLIKEQGNTVPFVARYRKSETGDLSEEDIRAIIGQWEYLTNLETRKQEIIDTLTKREKLTPELSKAVKAAETQQELEELYQPYKQKKKTRGMRAKERGLAPLALAFLEGQVVTEEQAEKLFLEYIDEEKGVETMDEALQGAKDIIAEKMAEKIEVRRETRDICTPDTQIVVEVKDKEQDEKGVYMDYYSYKSNLSKLPFHRMMAINRGEKEGILKVNLSSPEQKVVARISRHEASAIDGYSRNVVIEAIEDSCKRLLVPSVQRELRKNKTEEAELHAISVFTENLERLLMQPPIKGKVILGVDPAYKSGCKLAVVERTGEMAEVDVIYPTPPINKREQAKKKIMELVNKHGVEIIAIGNGTASRETEEFIADTIQHIDSDVQYAIVSEDGASVYSASKLAKEEFPELDVQERSAISIARRVLDPLAELVKIDPKSLGVGQYQHDVSQTKLREAVQFVVEKVVNQVGVDINTTSMHLLRYISGLNKTSAENIVARRSELGGFSAREELKSVRGLGEKTYEQCAGFLRILDGENPLDKTAIHPESYHIAKKLLDMMGETEEGVGSQDIISKVRQQEQAGAQLAKLAQELGTDEFTVRDILSAFKKPLYDPRDELEKPRLKKGILKIEDLSEGMVLEGEVRNVVDFGAFVDLGLKEDGLIHISNLSDSFVNHPLDIVSVGDVVTVEVISIDQKRGRIGLRKTTS